MYPAMATEWMTGQQQAKCFIKYEVGQTSRGKTNGKANQKLSSALATLLSFFG